MIRIGIFSIYFYPLIEYVFGINFDYRSFEVSMIWYNLIVDWSN